MIHRLIRSSNRGITLIELLVAVSIGTIVILSLAGLLGRASTLYARTEREVEVDRDGRAAIERLRRDLGSRMPGLPMYYQRDHGAGRHVFAFFTVQPKLAQEPENPGDVCYVAYVSALTPDRNDRVSRKLFRIFESSATAMGRLEELDLTPRPVDSMVDDVMAFNLLDFRVDFFAREEQGGWKKTATPDLAARADLSLRLLTSEVVAELEDAAAWAPPGPENGAFDFDEDEDNDSAARTYRASFFLQ